MWPVRKAKIGVADPADPRDKVNRSGGWYELAVELAAPDEARVDAVWRELFRLAGVEPAPGGSVLRLPDGARVVCTSAVVEEGEVGRSVWVVLGLPIGSLGRADPLVDDDTDASWRPPLDAWLASLALRLFEVVPFSLALIGHEISGDMNAAELSAAGPPAEHPYFGYVSVTDRPTYHPRTI